MPLTGNGLTLDALNPDPEGIGFAAPGELVISCERDLAGDPAIYRFDTAGVLLGKLPVDTKFEPTPNTRAQTPILPHRTNRL